MSRRWTDAQWEAITAGVGDLLVSAGAGAGKTAVLVERVLCRLTGDGGDPVDVDRLLVVTFTEAAAAELKARIAAEIRRRLAEDPENERLERQLALSPRAPISTLHSLCHRLLRRHFDRIGLDPSFRVLDEHAALILRHQALEQLLEDAFAGRLAAPREPDFLRLADAYGGRQGEALASLVLQVHQLAVTQPDPDAWLDGLTASLELPEAGQDGSAVVNELKRSARIRLQQASWRLAQALEWCALPEGPEAYAGTLEAERDRLDGLARELDNLSWDDIRRALATIDFGRLPQARSDLIDSDVKERVRKLREAAKDTVQSLLEGPFQYSLAEARRRQLELRVPTEALVTLVRTFDQVYSAAKQAVGGLDFNDLERACLRLLRGDAAGAGQPFAEVLVDEYQDINPLQDALLSLLSGEANGRARRFMVGDVRQSIYRFRLAEPGIFLARRRAYPTETGPCRRIELRDNFRSRPNVLFAVNYVFRQLFASGPGEVGFDDDAELHAGRAFTGPDPRVELHILERNRGALQHAASQAGTPSAAEVARLESDEREAEWVARCIRRLLDGEAGPPQPITDPDTGELRPPRPGDIAILLRSPRHRAETYAAALRRHGIPAAADLRSGYFDSLEVITMLNLLRVIENPRQDIPLASVLHSPIGGFDAADLGWIRTAAPGDFFDAFQAARDAAEGLPSGLPQRLEEFWQRLEGWRDAARRESLGDLLWRLLEDTGYRDYVSAMPGGDQRAANLEHLLHMAGDFDRSSGRGLAGFIRFVERLEDASADVGGSARAPEGDAVQILSIHQSKGLEFPVVFVAELGRQFNRRDLQGSLLLHREMGLGPRWIDPDRGLQAETPARLAVRDRLEAEMLAEEMRVLYVAMTRARERLVLVGSAEDLPSRARGWALAARQPGEALPDALVLDASGFLDWLAPCLARHRDGAAILAASQLPVLPAARKLFEDRSRWTVRLWPAEDVVQLAPGDAPQRASLPAPWDDLAAGRRPPDAVLNSHIEPTVAAWVQRLERPAAAGPGQRIFAKASVTELAGRGIVAASDEEAVDLSRESGLQGAWTAVPSEGRIAARTAPASDDHLAGWTPRSPDRLLGGPGGTTGTPAQPLEAGVAIHRFLQHLDLSADLDVAGLRRQARQLAADGLLTPEQAAVLPLSDLAACLALPLGRRLQRAYRSGRLRREVAFSLRVPAVEIDPAAPASDWVLVQGVIDALWEEEEGLVVVDYKTDRVSGGVAARVARYRQQVAWYRRAVTSIFERPVVASYLFFLSARRAVAVEAASAQGAQGGPAGGETRAGGRDEGRKTPPTGVDGEG